MVYDGECPMCDAYIKCLRLRRVCGSVLLIDARKISPDQNHWVPNTVSLDEGILVWIGESFYHGADAIHVLALLTSETFWFNRLNYLVFQSERLSRLIYPTLRLGRRTLLALLGRHGISSTS